MVDGILLVRVAAPPADSAANTALVRILASALDVPVSAIRIVAGAGSRRKLIDVAGTDGAALRSRWRNLDV